MRELLFAAPPAALKKPATVSPQKRREEAGGWRTGEGVQKPEGAAGAPGGQRPPESGPRPFLHRRPSGKQQVRLS